MGGELIRNPPSPFLDEIPKNLLTICRGDYRREKDARNIEDQEYRWEPLRSSAALANKSQKVPAPLRKKARSSPDSPFTNGQAVHHAKFGRGTVLESEGSGENLKLTIRFKEGVKRILLKYAPLVAMKAKHRS
jgi:DNA helicase-2/ATP-dependent DNA helicase PcrA